jgi:CRISPR-associated protein Cas1
MKGSGRETRSSNPRALILSKRANVFYLEHARVVQKDERVVYLTQYGGDIEKFFNIPERNTAFLLLGKGTSISDAAARKLADSNVMVGFCGSGGSPLFGAVEPVFLAPQSEYRPTIYMQNWMRAWLDEAKRLELGKRLLAERLSVATNRWGTDSELSRRGIVLPESAVAKFERDIQAATSATQLLSAEAHWAKSLYGSLARNLGFDFTRKEGAGLNDSLADVANGFLDHGNYIAYGFASTALFGLGISFSLPVLHGKTRRGALVFDIADLVKDAYVMPLAFLSAKRRDSQDDFRAALIERCQAEEVLDYLFTFLTKTCEDLQ